MKDNTCCFTGHRAIASSDAAPIRELLKNEIARQAEKGRKVFCAGGARGFDTIAAECVLEAKNTDPDIKLLLFLPHKGQASSWREAEKARYAEILARADGISYACEEYVQGCMLTRNRQLCDAASVCIAFLEHGSGGTFYTVKYAREHGLEIINLAKRLRGLENEN
ncbi:MAG: DUF1273 family protein [Clostridia bacterium]|nr:DUF1273 family protein [Clostridia bacterium]